MCPIDLWSDIIHSQISGQITPRQREDLHHLVLLGDDQLAKEGLARLKAEFKRTHKISRENLLPGVKHGQPK